MDEEKWYSELPEELHEGVQRFKTPQDIAKSYIELEKSSSSKVKLPGEDASDDDWGKFFTKVGASDKPEDYSVENLPENADAEFMKAMQQLAAEAKVPKRQFKKLAEGYLKYEAQLTQKMQQAQDAAREETLKSIAKELGGEDKLKEVITSAQSAANVLDEKLPGLKDYFEKSGWGDDPMMIKLFHYIGSQISPDTLVKGKGGQKPPEKKSRWEKEFEERYGKAE